MQLIYILFVCILFTTLIQSKEISVDDNYTDDNIINIDTIENLTDKTFNPSACKQIQGKADDKITNVINKINADTTEYLMHKTFRKNGWKQIQGEVGNNGIDGLYIKTNAKGTVTNVMFGEAKYNSATLGKGYYGTDTKNVKQMSKTALNHQIDNLIKKYSDNKQYSQIKQHLQNGSYRARIFHLKRNGDFLIPRIEAIDHNGDINIQKIKLLGNQNYKINNMRVNINNPQNSFEKRFVEDYKRGLKNNLMKKFKFSAIDSQNIYRKSPFINMQTIKEQIEVSKNIKNTVSKSFNKSATSINNGNIKHLKIKTRSDWKSMLKTIRKIK